MGTIEQLVRVINRDLSPQFEERLRAALADKDRDWLIDQVVRLTLDSHSLEDLDVAAAAAAKARRRAERVARVTAVAMDGNRVREFSERYAGMSRERPQPRATSAAQRRSRARTRSVWMTGLPPEKPS